MNKKLISIFLVFLLVSFPFSLAQVEEPKQPPTKEPVLDNNDDSKEDETDIVRPILPNKEDIDIDKNLTITGQDVFASDFLVKLTDMSQLF